MTELLMGYAKTDITPDRSVETVGFGGNMRSQGVLEPLIAQVSVWKDAGEACCLIAIDHIGYSIPHAVKTREAVGEALSVSKDKVMLCFSHTHAAPNDSAEQAYFEECLSRLVAAARLAASDMTPVKAAWGNARARIGINRRANADELDDRIGILRVDDAREPATRLIVLRLSAHANVLKQDNHMISPDYFGAARDMLAKTYHCPVMITQGASGDVAPMFFSASACVPGQQTPDYYGGHASDTALEDMAKEITRAVKSAVGGIIPTARVNARMYTHTTRLFADVPTVARALEIAEEAKREAGIEGGGWLSEVRRLNDEGVKTQAEDVEIQYFTVADGCLCGVPNEIMSAFALRAAKDAGNPHFYFGGYTNGCLGYFPTESEYDKGGYEVYWSMLIYYIYFHRVSSLNRDSASRLITEAVMNAPEDILRCGCETRKTE